MADKTSRIYINGKQAGDTLADLRKRAAELNREINQLAPGTDAYKQKMQEFGMVNSTLQEHQQALRNVGSAMANASTSAEQRLAELNDRVNSGTMSVGQLAQAVKEYETIALQAGMNSPVGTQAIGDGANLMKTISALKSEMQKFAAAEKTVETQTEATTKDIYNMGAKFEDVYGDLQPLSSRLGELEDRLYELALAGKTNTHEFKTLQAETVRYRETIIAVDRNVDLLAEKGGKLGVALELGSTVAAGYSAFEGVLALTGNESEEVTRSIQKLTAITNVLNGVEQMRLNLGKKSYIMMKAQAIGSTMLSAAQMMYTTAIGTSTGALKLFRLALISTGIGAIIVAVGLLIANFDKLQGYVMKGYQAFDKLGTGIKIALAVIFPYIGAIYLAIKALKHFGIISDEVVEIETNAAKARRKLMQEELNMRKQQTEAAIEANKRQMWSIGDMYDFEIEKAKAAGKNTYELEKEKRAAMLLTHQESIRLNREALMLNATSFSAMLGNVKAIVDSEKAIIAINRTEELEEIRRRKEASDAAKKAAETAKSEAKKMSDELAKLKENELKYRADLETNASLERLKDEEKEQAQAQLKIEQKYEKDLESARKLALQKGEIGRQATEQLQTLELLMAEELESERLKIKEKWEKQNAENLKKLRQDSMKRELAINSAMLNTEMAEAKMVYNSIADHEVEAKEAALREIERLTMLQLENERDTKLNAIKNQLENEEINLLEFQVLKEQLEAEHQLRIEDMNRETQERIAQSYVENMTNALETTKTLMSEFGKLRDALHAREMQDIATERDARISALDEQLNSGLISEREHADKVQAIKDQAAEKERAEKTRQAQAQKGAALIEAAINTALAVISGFAQGGPPLAALAAVVGALQVATIAAQPIPQFKDGGFNVTGAQDGKSYQAKYIGKHPGGMLPNHPVVLASEAGPEYFVPNPLLHNPVVLDAVRTIENIRLRQFAQGGATQPLPTPMANANGNENEQLFAALLQSIQQNSAMQQELMRMLPNLGVYFSDERIEKLMERNGEIAGIRA